MIFTKNPLIFALDVDSEKEAFERIEPIADLIGAIKVGPRLVNRYGELLVQKLSKLVPVFIDNKFFDIPSTMEASVQAAFDAGATLVTVHALSGFEALSKLKTLEIRLNQIRPFKILAVTVLTSWSESSFPLNFQLWSIENHVKSLSKLVLDSGLDGIVCSGHELELLKQDNLYKVVPGIRLESDKLTHQKSDQKRVMSPRQAIQAGAQAIVIGRPILDSSNPRKTVLEILESIVS